MRANFSLRDVHMFMACVTLDKRFIWFICEIKYILKYIIFRRGYAFSQEEGGAVSQTEYIRSYDTTTRSKMFGLLS